MISFRVLALLCLVASIAVGCSPSAQAPTQTTGGAASPAAQPPRSRTLEAVIRVEPAFVAAKSLQQAGLTLGSTIRLFNAGLSITDAQGASHPYLVESLPELNTDSWQVFPDGRMQTTYRLKSNLTWHDGAPLTAEDLVLAWRVYTTPDFGLANSAPQALMDEVTAVDSSTVVIRWKRPYPFADVIEAVGQRNLPPLPRHLLEQPLQQLSSEAFAALPYWSTEYVGLGPFKLDRWEQGAFIEASAFDGHALGRPKIDRLRLTFINDANAALASILSGSTQLLADDAIYFQQTVVLRREWSSNQGGTILVSPGLWRYTQIQLHPERLNARPLLDPRVRKALAHGVNKESIREGIYEGEGINSDSVIPPTADYYSQVDRGVVKYPFDPRQSEQLMAEAGFSKGSDGYFTSPAEGRFSPELKVIQNAQNEAEQAIMANSWRQVGFDVREAVLPAAQAQDGQTRATFQAMFTTGGPLGESALQNLGTLGIPRPENRWNGTNRSSWTNPEYDRLVEAYNTTLQRNERIQQIVRMVAIFSDELPALAINFNPGIIAHSQALRGPGVASPDSSPTWDVHLWELR